MGVKIPQLGYLDPHPRLHFENFYKKRFSSHWKAVLFSIVLDIYNYSFIWQMDGNLFHQGTMIGGGGQDTPAGVSWPPPKTAFWKFLQKRFSSHWKAVLFSIVLDVYNYSFIWQMDGNLFHQGTMIGGGGQDTPAGVSWPPPKTAFWKFLQKRFSSHWKAVLFSIVLDVYNYSFIWQMDGNLFHQGTMIGGGGQDTPAGVSWPPPKTAFWKFLQKKVF